MNYRYNSFQKNVKILIKDTVNIIFVSGIELHIPYIKSKMLNLAQVIAKAPHTLSVLSKHLKVQDKKIGN